MHTPDAPVYPASFTVTSGGLISYNKRFLGLYALSPEETINGQPIWKKDGSQETIFYKDGKWRIDQVASRDGSLRSPKTFPEVIPESGWEYKAGNHWSLEHSLKMRT